MSKPSARGIVVNNGKILLIYREKNGNTYFSVPGGKREENETFEETVVREILEETSIKVTVDKYLGTFKSDIKEKDHYLYLCKYVEGEPKLGNADEKSRMEQDSSNVFDPKWVSLKEIQQLTLRPNTMSAFVKEFVKQYE